VQLAYLVGLAFDDNTMQHTEAEQRSGSRNCGYQTSYQEKSLASHCVSLSMNSAIYQCEKGLLMNL